MSSPWSGTDMRAICSSVFLHVYIFYVGVLSGGNLCEHGENMQTLHRKAWEIAHLSTEGLGRTCPQYQQRPMRESNPGPSCCEAAVQAPEPPCHILYHVQYMDINRLHSTGADSDQTKVYCRSKHYHIKSHGSYA